MGLCGSGSYRCTLLSDVNGFFPVEKNHQDKKNVFFLVSRIKFVNNGKASCLCVE